MRVLVSALGHLPDETVDTVLDQILDDAPELTTGQLRARVSRLVMGADPDGAKSSYQEGLADRHVATGPNLDHTAQSVSRESALPAVVRRAQHAPTRSDLVSGASSVLIGQVGIGPHRSASRPSVKKHALGG